MSDRYSPLLELTVSRTKEFFREPEAVFWVFAFPVLLAIALGLAFREKGPDQIPVGVVRSAETRVTADRALSALARAMAARSASLTDAGSPPVTVGMSLGALRQAASAKTTISAPPIPRLIDRPI